jgi:hypothetical protein
MALPSGLPEHVDDAERVARHVFTKQHIASDPKDAQKKWAKPQAFYPLPSEEGWVFSVSRTLTLPDDEAIQRNGLEVGKVSGRSLKGCALVQASSIREVPVKDDGGSVIRHLDAVPHELPNGSTPYHAHVSGFLPLPIGANPKEFFKEAAEELASRSKEEAFIRRSLATDNWEVLD